MRLLLQQLAPRKESLTMENVFAPQAQQLQRAISQELSIAAEVCRAYATSYDLLLRLRPFRAESVPNSRLQLLGMDIGQTDDRRQTTDRQFEPRSILIHPNALTTTPIHRYCYTLLIGLYKPNNSSVLKNRVELVRVLRPWFSSPTTLKFQRCVAISNASMDAREAELHPPKT